MLQIIVFTSIEMTSRISTSKIFVFTFYLNYCGLWCKPDCCTKQKIAVSLQCLLVVAH